MAEAPSPAAAADAVVVTVPRKMSARRVKSDTDRAQGGAILGMRII